MPHKDPEKQKAYMKRWRAANADRLRLEYERRKIEDPEELRRKWRESKVRHRLKPETRAKQAEYRRNGYRHTKAAGGLVTRQEADAMIAAQRGRCYICNEKPSGKRGCARLNIDHCHATKVVRKALCHRCNKALGLAVDRPDILRRMADYLEAHRVV